jgi:microcystin-dependent protein
MLASIMLFAGKFAPRGWAFCDGQLLPIVYYPRLFYLIGTTYGGDGINTFALPDMRGRVAVGPRTGQGLPSFYLGQQGGTHLEYLSEGQIPSFPNGADLESNQAMIETRRTGAAVVTDQQSGPSELVVGASTYDRATAQASSDNGLVLGTTRADLATAQASSSDGFVLGNTRSDLAVAATSSEAPTQGTPIAGDVPAGAVIDTIGGDNVKTQANASQPVNYEPIAGDVPAGAVEDTFGGNNVKSFARREIQGHNNMQPFLGVNYIIAVNGYYPW